MIEYLPQQASNDPYIPIGQDATVMMDVDDTTPSTNHEFPVPNTSISVANAFLLQGFLVCPNRLAFGERRLIVHTPTIALKSYGKEKRFICPPPTCQMIGRAWWSKTAVRGDYNPPLVNFSISDEETNVSDDSAAWLTTQGRVFADRTARGFHHGEQPFLGKASAKNVYITDGAPDGAQQKRSEVIAKVDVKIQGVDPKTIGVFESKPIVIVSKPSKKTPSSRTSNVFLVKNGSTVSLYNRIKAQTNSTTFLAVSPDLTKIRGSDGKSLPTAPETTSAEPRLTTDKQHWDPFHIWLVDPTRQTAQPTFPGGSSSEPLPPPMDALVSTDSAVYIRYNQTVRLQCPTTGLISPVYVLRRTDNVSTAYGGDSPEPGSASMVGFTPPGETPGEAIRQLYKVGLELYTPSEENLLFTGENDSPNTGQWLATGQDSIVYCPEQSAREYSETSSGSSEFNGSSWSVKLPETAIWTFVCTATETFTFFVPPGIQLDEPVTPIPRVFHVTPPGYSGRDDFILNHAVLTTLSEKPQATLYGKHFEKNTQGHPKYTVWWGPRPASDNEYKCQEVMTSVVPFRGDGIGAEFRYQGDVPVSLIRADGHVLVPTDTFLRMGDATGRS